MQGNELDYGMSCRKHSRRAFLRVMSGALGAWLTLDLSKVAHAAQEARRAQEAAGEAATSFLSKAEFADVEAIAAQIIPTDATPGAREAGVALFIDRALATFFGRLAPDFRSQLAASACVARRSIPMRNRLRRSRTNGRSRS